MAPARPLPSRRPSRRRRRGRVRLGLVLGSLALLVGLTAWALLRSPGRTGSGASSASASDAVPGAAMEPRALGAARAPDAAAERAQVAESAASARAADAGTRRENFDLDGAGWIAGRVRLPPAAPADATLRVVAASRDGGPAPSDATAAHWLERLAASDTGDGRERIAWRPVGPNGSFRVPVDADARRAALQVDGRYLYLARAQVADAGATDVELSPSLGGWLVVQLELPPRLPADVDPSGLVGGRAVLSGFRTDGGHRSGFVGRSARVDDTLAIHFRGVPDGWTLVFTARVPGFVPLQDSGWAVVAGERSDKRVALRLGVRASGRVLGPDGDPVEGARLSCSSNDRHGFASGASGDARSGADGSFVLFGGRPGAELELRAEREGFAPGRFDLGDCEDGERIVGVEIRLGAGLPLSGRVQFPDGRPARGAEVAVWVRMGMTYPAKPSARTTAGADGAFAVRGLEGSTWFVRAAADETGAAVSEYERDEDADTFGVLRWQRAVLRAGTDSSEGAARLWRAHAADVEAGTAEPLVLELRAPSALRGTVVDDLGAPLDAFRVRAVARSADTIQPDGQPLRRSFDGAGGRFELPGLEPGRWIVTVEAPGHQDAAPSSVVVPDDRPLEFVLTRAAELRGVVLDPGGRPVAGANVTSTEGDARRTATNSDGTFVLTDVPPGSVVLLADHEAFAPSEPLALEVAVGEVATDITLELLEGGALRGVIYRSDGSPDPGRTIQLLDMARSGGGVGPGMDNTVSNAAGRFRMTGITPGKYQVMAQPDSAGMTSGADEDPAALLEQMKMESVEIRAGEVTEVVLGAPPADPVDVRGVVTEAGEAVAGAVVMAVLEGDSVLSNMKMATTDAGGSYALTVPQPGLFAFMVMSGVDGRDSVEFPVEVPAGGEATVDLALPLGRLEGRVVDASGRGVALARVRIRHEQALSSLMDMDGGRDLGTDEQGGFAFTHLQPGTYTVRALGPWSEDGRARGLRAGVAVAADAATTGVLVALDPPGTVRGTVRDAAGEPVADATVFVRGADGRLIDLVSDVTTDGAGRFEYADVPAGAVTVSASKGEATTAESAAYTLAAGGAVEVDLTLAAGTMLVLSLEDGEGRTLRAYVEVLDAAGRDWSLRGGGDLLARTLSEGISSTERRVGPLPAGEYRVTARTPDGRSATEPVALNGQEERRVRLRLRERGPVPVR